MRSRLLPCRGSNDVRPIARPGRRSGLRDRNPEPSTLAKPVLVILAMAMTMALPQPTSASCENLFEAKSSELWFIYNDVYPVPGSFPRTPAVDSLYAADLRAMWDAMAHGLAMAVACQKRIDADTGLAELLTKSPIHLAMTPRGPLRPGPVFDRSRPAPPESVITLFTGLEHDSTALLYSIRLGSFADSVSAARSSARFAWLDALREEAEEWDSTLVLDWKHEDCSIGDSDRPTLFVLPPGASGTGRWEVLSGLIVGRRDANLWLATIRCRGEAKAEVIPIRVTGMVLSHAIPPH